MTFGEYAAVPKHPQRHKRRRIPKASLATFRVLLERRESGLQIGTLDENRQHRIGVPGRNAIDRVSNVKLLWIEVWRDFMPLQRHRYRSAADRPHAVWSYQQLAVRILAPIEVHAAAARSRIARGRCHIRMLALDENSNQMRKIARLFEGAGAAQWDQDVQSGLP